MVMTFALRTATTSHGTEAFTASKIWTIFACAYKVLYLASVEGYYEPYLIMGQTPKEYVYIS